MCDLKTLTLDDRAYETRHTRKFERRKPYAPKDPRKLHAYIPGVIRKVYVEEGQAVRRGEALLVLEAMKMQNDLLAKEGGDVKSIHVKTGEMVAKGQLLMEFA